MRYIRNSNNVVEPGQKYGKLTVVEFKNDAFISDHERKSWICKCECGTIVVKRQRYLRRQKKAKACKKCLPSKQPWNKKDISVGDRFGKLLVTEYLGYQECFGGCKYKCRCDCGNIRNATAYHLTRMSKPYRDCSRQPCSGNRAWNNKYTGEMPGLYWAHLTAGAKARKHGVHITPEQAWHQFEKQNGKCALSGVKLYFSEYWRDEKRGTASLDRIDSSKGYSVDNIQWVHKSVNKMKNTFNQTEFVEWCKTIANNQLEKSNAS